MRRNRQGGFTTIELLVTLIIFSVVIVSIFGLYTSLVQSTIIAKRRAIGLSLATNQMEYLKSLPYDKLAVEGGAINAGIKLPSTKTDKINGVTYTTKTSVNYVDNAFDGCANYPNPEMKKRYCRNFSTSTTTTVDKNPQDYKVAHVTVTDNTGKRLAEVDTNIAARVAETDSATGALFVSAVDDNGNPVSGASIEVSNNTVTPNVLVNDTTDDFGVAIFYGLPPDSGADYVISGSKDQYSSLYTVGNYGSKSPTYPNQKILTQQSSHVTLILKPQGKNSLIIETTDLNGNPLPEMRIFLKGGYKKYTSLDHWDYYYDNVVPTDKRVPTDSNGLVAIHDLAPGRYFLCGADGSEACQDKIHTGYYAAAVIPYGGSNSLNPIVVPSYRASDPPTETFAYGGQSYLQKARVMLTKNFSFPRIQSITPDNIIKSSGNMNSFMFNIEGVNLSCGTGGGCNSIVKFVQSGVEYNANCSGSSAGRQLSCTVNIGSMSVGQAQIVIGTTTQGTMTLPTGDLMGGLRVE